MVKATCDVISSTGSIPKYSRLLDEDGGDHDQSGQLG